jgi:AbrB family looped-hinge helix DNA binding protein
VEVIKMNVETVRMSSKGQVVIPLDIREEVNVDEGTLFAVVGTQDTIILKRITTPSKEELIKDLGFFAKKAKMKLQSKGVTEKDLQAK